MTSSFAYPINVKLGELRVSLAVCNAFIEAESGTRIVRPYATQVAVEQGCQSIGGAGSPTCRPSCPIELRPRLGRQSHNRIVLDAAQRELANAPVQTEAGGLRLGHVRREDVDLPAAPILDQAA